MRAFASIVLATSCLAAIACGDDDPAASSTGESTTDSTASASTPVSTAVAASTATTASGAGANGAGGNGDGGDGGGAGGSGAGGWELAFDPIDLDGELNIVTDFRFLPDAEDEFLVLEKSGAIHHYRIDGDTTERLGGFTLEVHDDLDCGLISLAFSPDFADDRGLYLGFCETRYGSRVDRVRFDAEDYDGVPETAETILLLDEPNAAQPWHNVGAMGFEPGGILWVLAGEKTVPANAQDLGNDLGKLLRVVPETDGPGSSPAPDNPFIDQEGMSPNVFAYGLRSPWKGARDSLGRYWFGDVGQDTWEEVNLVSEPGQNFGWPMHEGPCDPEVDDGCVDPITLYGRSSTDPYLVDDPDHLPAGTRSVWVGPFIEAVEGDPYQGALDDHLVFGDLHTGFVRMLHVGADGSILEDRPVAHLNHGHAWDRGPEGWLHVMTFGTLLGSDTLTAELFRVRLE